ncbi:MAG: sulfatase-like hydrolase/transferase [Verrucomicrobiota bacterium]
MKRRHFLSRSSAAATLSSAPLTTSADTPSPPNLLIIHCDELNFRTLGCYRDTLPEEQAYMWGKEAYCPTPHIDSLAGEGALWTKCYAATPVCSPSRSSFLTGNYPQNTPVTSNNIHFADGNRTFAHVLQEAGYHTGYAGKWHLDGDGKPQWAPERNFGFLDNRFMFNRGHWKQFEDTPEGPRVKARDKKGAPSYSVAGADESSFATDWLTDKAIDYIDEHRDRPFCYMVSIPDPHGPDTVRAPYDTLFDDALTQKPRTHDRDAKEAPAWAKPSAKCPYKMAQYHGMVKCIDDNVGRLLNHLSTRGLLDQTIVVFTADHGDMRGEHGRQNKGVPLEASAKIPFIVRYPKGIPAGQRHDWVINTVDFLPTVLTTMGFEQSIPEGVQGRNLVDGPGNRPDVTFFRSTSNGKSPGNWVGAVTPRFKLLLSPQERPWLFDLESEPDELENHIDRPEHRDQVADLAAQLLAYFEATNDPFKDHEKVVSELNLLAS